MKSLKERINEERLRSFHDRSTLSIHDKDLHSRHYDDPSTFFKYLINVFEVVEPS